MRTPDYLNGITRVENDPTPRRQWLRLDKNENLFPVPATIISELRAGLTGDWLSCYPQTDGLYTALAALLALPAEQLYLTAGSDAGIKNVFEVFAVPGNRVVSLDPSYAMYGVYTRLFRMQWHGAGFDDRLRPDLARLLAGIDADCALVLLANPNSPTGTVLAVTDIVAILERAASYGVPVLIDEAYYPFHPETQLPLLARYDNLIITRTFSKAFSLAAARLGMIIARPEMITVLKKWRPMYEVNGFAVLAGQLLCGHHAWVAETVRATIAARDWFAAAAAARGLPVINTSANFVHVGLGESLAGFLERCRREKILLKENAAPDCLRGYVRVAIAPQPQLQRVLDLLPERQ